MRNKFNRYLFLCGFLAVIGGCSEENSCQGEMCAMSDLVATRAPLTAYCSIVVKNYGTVDMETDYVPNVTCCENGGAPEQALRAQAVAARSVAYHNLGGGVGTASNPIGDSQAVQVYSCGGRADSRLPLCKAAATDTSGMILSYKNTTLCAFYVSGSKVACLDDNCVDKGDTTASCYASQQKYVTYNEGKSGDGITQSTQGWVNAKNYANRGTMSQNGASCLDSKRGYNWVKIVRYFYGEDIDIVKTSGTCVQAAASIPDAESAPAAQCETTLSKSETVIDDKDPCFSRSSVESWYEQTKGYGSHLYYTFGWADEAEAIGKWTVNVTRPGTYEVFAYVDGSAATGSDSMTQSAPYSVRASGTEHKVSIDMSKSQGWVSLGTYTFAAGGDQWIKLTDSTGEKYDQNAKKVVVFDAVKFVDAATCESACPIKDSLECSGNGYRKCIDPDGNGCLKWSEVTSCESSETCKNGACTAQETPDACADDCSEIGETSCASDGGYRTCGSFDADSCLDWSEITACNPDQKCVSGACVANPDISCAHECVDGETICDGDGLYKICGFFDDDACREFSESKSCGENEVCRFGACVPTSDSSGKKSCVLAIDGRASTIIDELDPCFERSNVVWSQLSTYGYDNHLFYANVNATGSNNAVGTWHLNVEKAGKYTIRVYIESGIGNVIGEAQYTVSASGKLHKAIISTANQSGWVTLGTYDLEAGTQQYVRLSDDSYTVSAPAEGERFVFDAVEIVPYGTQNDDNGGGGEDDGGGNGTGGESDCSAAPQSAPGALPGALLAIAFGFGLNAVRRRRKTESCGN